MKRREFLELSALAASQFVLSSASQASPEKERRYIDIHCHFFNAADIPVRNFVRVVVLSDYERVLPLPEKSDFPSGSVGSGLASVLIDFLVASGVPSPDDELRCLKTAGSCSLGEIADKSLLSPDSRQAAILANSIRKRLQPIEEKSGSVPSGSGDVQAFLDFVFGEMNVKAPELNAPGDKSLGDDDAAKAGRFLLSGGSVLSRYFDWAKLLRGYRTEIASTYVKLFASGRYKLALATPALVDYSFWLNDRESAALKSQIELMGKLSARRGQPVLGFVPFDPLRDIQKGGEGTSLKLVKDAISQNGFLGVKLYSPMGFRPMGNAVRPIEFPAHLGTIDAGFGERLDSSLWRLYDFCANEDVPIMAHTLDSQASNKGFGKRAEPKFWAQVLEKYPALRVNLAHFGNFTLAMNGGSDPVSLFPSTWENEIGEFVSSGRNPNVFADISYFSWVLNDASRAADVLAIKKLFGAYLGKYDPQMKTLMFGTDWSMIARERNVDSYLSNVEQFFRDVGADDAMIDNLFYTNAVRFLGLNGATKTRGRIERFYARAQLAPPVF
jgi:predicted TIM-barrel fold metal-dependent hydrolase